MLKRFCSYILLLAASFLTACTIIDNDLRSHSDVPGVDEVAHVETEEYTLDYQYTSGVMALDDNFQNYIVRLDTAARTLYLEGYTPDDVLPRVGQVVASGITEKLTWGLGHRVTSVSRSGDLYALGLERVPLDQVYKTLRLDGEFTVMAIDTTQAAAARPATRSWLSDALDGKPVNENFAMENDYMVFNLISLLANDGAEVSFDTSKLYDGPVKGQADFSGSFIIKWKPVLKFKVYIDMESEACDINVTAGNDWKINADITGSASLSLDLFQLLGMPKLEVPVPLVPFIDLFAGFEATLTVEVGFEGGWSAQLSNIYATTVGFRNNIPGEDDGPYCYRTKQKPSISSSDDLDSSDTEWSFNLGFKLGAESKMFFGVPQEPQAGIYFGFSGGPSFKDVFAGSDGAYGKYSQSGIDLQAGGGVYLDILPWIGYKVDLIDLLAKTLGVKEGVSVTIPGTESKYRYYPSIDNVEAKILNEGNHDEAPHYYLSYTSEDRGFAVGKNVPIHARYSLFFKGGSIAQCVFDDPNELVTGKNMWCDLGEFIGGLWDEEYEIEITMYIRNPKTNQEIILYRKRYPISSSEPSAHIVGDVISSQWKKNQTYYTGEGIQYYYDWMFHTYVQLNNSERITSLGFAVDGKVYVLDPIPNKDYIDILWKVTNSTRCPRVIKIKPIITYVNSQGSEVTEPQDTYEVKLDFDYDSPWNEEGLFDMIDHVRYSTYGYNNIQWEDPADVDMSTQ